MKRLVLSVFFLGIITCFIGCSGDSKQENTDENTADSTATTDVKADPNAQKVETGDAQGEDEEVSTASATKDDSNFIRFKANGIDMSCTYASNTNQNIATFQRKKDDSYSMIVFERGSTDQLREKIMINFINYNPRALDFPYEIKPEGGKHFQVNYAVKKSGIYITYFANAKNGGDKFKITLTGYDDGVLKGTFEGEVQNAAKKIINIEEGEFEIKFEETILDAENPA